MTDPIETLLAASRDRSEASVVAPITIRPGGVDPLGLRQINFDLMDRIIPGLNNVVGHIRPFTFMTWAWRRARQRLKDGAQEPGVTENFVDRLETVFAWSQFLNDPQAGLPGSQALAPILAMESYRFDGKTWTTFRDVRHYSTGIGAPVNYGPALKSLKWVGETRVPRIFKPNPEHDQMLDAFEATFTEELSHPLFNDFGPVEVEREDVRRWGQKWALGELLAQEQTAAFDALAGSAAPEGRQQGVALTLKAVRYLGTSDVAAVRRLMAEAQHEVFEDPACRDAAAIWRTVQVRQLFRLCLEATFRWICQALVDGPKPTGALVDEFLGGIDRSNVPPDSSAKWVELGADANDNPVRLLEEVQDRLDHSEGLEQAIIDGLLFCMAVSSSDADLREMKERLPLWFARLEFEQLAEKAPEDWISHILERWVLAQHLYWSVSRGLGDARGGNRALLRLRVTMEEGGWCLIDGASVGAKPEPTADRLGTLISLLREAGKIDE